MMFFKQTLYLLHLPLNILTSTVSLWNISKYTPNFQVLNVSNVYNYKTYSLENKNLMTEFPISDAKFSSVSNRIMEKMQTIALGLALFSPDYYKPVLLL